MPGEDSIEGDPMRLPRRLVDEASAELQRDEVVVVTDGSFQRNSKGGAVDLEKMEKQDSEEQPAAGVAVKRS
ncbi:hypothetical protein AWENTII_012470 [Aspergillus wentii]